MLLVWASADNFVSGSNPKATHIKEEKVYHIVKNDPPPKKKRERKPTPHMARKNTNNVILCFPKGEGKGTGERGRGGEGGGREGERGRRGAGERERGRGGWREGEKS